MSRLRNYFISGVVTFLPLALSIYIIVVAVSIVENLLGQFLRLILPAGAYLPGMGFAATISVIILMGFLVNNFVTAAFFKNIQEKLTEVPLIKTVYAPLRDLMNLFAKGQQQQTLQKVVLVHFTPAHSIIGLVTRENFSDLELKMNISKEKIAVYIPMSYGLGGYTILVNKAEVEPIDISVEKAMSLALTGWIKTTSEPSPKNKSDDSNLSSKDV
ncbi:MAG: DUF502 domain-containing protein [Pseudobdellovibrio sp.]